MKNIIPPSFVKQCINSSSRKFFILFLLLLLLISNSTSVFATTITISTNTNWSAITTGTGTGGQPSASDAIVINGGATLTVNVTTGICASIQIGGPNAAGAGILTFSGTNSSLSVTGTVTIGGYGKTTRTGTITFISGASLSAGSVILGNSNATPAPGTITMFANSTLSTGSFIVGSAGGTWTPSTGTVIMTATNTLPSTVFTSFNNLTITSGTTTASSNFAINGTLTTSSGSTLDMSTYVLSGSGTFTNNNGTIKTACLTTTSTTPIPTGKTWGGTVEYSATAGSQTVVAGTYNNLTLDNTSGNNNAGGGVTVNGTLTTTLGGTFDMSTYALTLGSSSTITNNGTIKTSNTSSTPIPTGKTWGGTVNYAAGGQTIVAGTYNNLSLTGNNTTGGIITVSGAFITSGTLTTATDITFNGTTTCGGNINATAGKTTYSSSGASILKGTYNDLVIPDNAILCDNITVNGKLTLGTGLNYNGYTISGLPTLTAVSITSNNANTAYAKTGDVITLTFTGSEALTSKPTVTIAGHTILSANVTNTSGNIWQAVYTMAAGDAEGIVPFTIDYSDLPGNIGTQVTTTTNSSSVTFDKTAPTVYILSPSNGASNVSINSNLIITFSENVKAGTAGNIIIHNASDNSAFESIPWNDARISYSGNTVTINPTNTFNGGSSYYVQINASAIQDPAGNSYTGISDKTSWAFSVPQPYYRSKASGNWNAASTWETSPDNSTWTTAETTPTAGNSAGILIQSGHTVTVSADVQADDLTVTGTLTVSSGVTLTIADGTAATDMTVNGTINNSGTITPTGAIVVNGTYAHAQNGGTIPTVTWNTGSTCSIISGFTGTTPTGLDQSFSNFTYNVTGQTLTLNKTLTVGGNLTITSGTVNGADQLINLTGNLTGAGTLSFTTGSLNIAGDNTLSGTFTCGTGTVNYNGTNQKAGGFTYYNLTLSNGGTKTLQAAANVSNVLTLTNGILQLGNYDLTLTSTNAIAGTFSNTNMIATDGSGKLNRSLAATNESFAGTYPVGSGGYYSPVSITALPAGAAASRTISVRAVASQPNTLTNAIKKYWELNSNLTSDANTVLSFQYDAAELVTGADVSKLKLYTKNSGNWTVATGSTTGSNSATSTGNLYLSGSYTICYPNQPTINGKLTDVCRGGTETYTVTPTFDSYTWTVTGGTPATGNSNPLNVTWGTDNSPKSLQVDVTASGFTSTATVPVTFFGQPDNPTTFTSSQTSTCPGSTGITYAIAPVSGATSYAWTVTPAGAATINGNSNSVTVDFAANAPHVVTITVTPQNSCPSLSSLSTDVVVGRKKIYAKESGDFSSIKWNDKSDGTGTDYTYSSSDASFYTFVIGNGYTVNVATPVNVGSLEVHDNNTPTTLSLNNTVSFTGCAPDTFYIGKNATVNYNSVITADGSGDLFLMDNGELKISMSTGSSSSLSPFETTTVTGGTINYSLSGNQDIIAPFTYYNLTLSGSGNKNLGAAITVNGDLKIDNSAVSLIVNDNQANITLQGNWINNSGNYSATGYPDAKVIFSNKTNNQTISGSTTFNRLVVDKTSTLYLYLDNSTTSNVFINKELTFSGRGILKVYNNNVTLHPGAKITDGGSNTTFDNGKMIEIDGTSSSGTLIKELTWAADFATTTLNDYSGLFPVGNTGKYAAMEIGSLLVSSFSGTKQISMKTTTFTSTLTDIVKRSWTISSDLTGITRAPFALFYNADELVGSPTNVTKDGTKVTGASNDVTTYTLQIPSNNVLFSGVWQCTGSSTDPRWIYTYNTGGDWDNINTWTTDPAGTIPNHVMPQTIDHVVILANATVTVTSSTKSVADLEIKENGTLDLTNTTSHTFGTIKGKGLMRLASINLPSANYDEFVAAGAGTIEYYNFTSTLPNSTTTNNKNQYNNLILSGTGAKSLVGTATYNIKGDLTVKGTGSLQIGDANSNSITINLDGDLTVSDNTASIGLGSGTSTHHLYIKGDFTNNGKVRFTNSTVTYPTVAFTNAQINSFYTRTVTGEAKLECHFTNSIANQTINCNGVTDFYRLEMNKGTDATYLLNVFSTAETNCRFWGLNNQADNPYADNTPQVSQQKYLSLQYGTLVLNSNIKIYSLTESGNFRINQYAIFNINGANILESTCYNGTGSTAPVIYGKMIVNNGVFDAGRSAGIILRSTGAYEQNGGTLYATQLRPSTTSGQHRGSVTITGGIFNIGQFNSQTGETGGSSALFCIPYPDQVFKMSGGTVNINDCRNDGDNYGGALHIGINASNYEVTGGTFNMYITKANNSWLTSTIPFYNINFYNTAGNTSVFQIHTLSSNPSGTNLATTPALPLIVLNDLTINSGTLDAASNDVYVRRHFTASGTYTTGTNTTYFDSNNQSLQNIIANSNVNFSSLTINNSASLGQVSLNGTGIISVTKNLSILQGTLNDNGKTLIVNGNVTNNSVHTGSGNITLSGGSTQHQINGNGSGLFGNLVLNDTRGALQGANQTIKGTLTLATTATITTSLYTIGAYKLTLYNDIISTGTAAFSNTKMIATSGNKSDLGVERVFGTTETTKTDNLIPIGCIATSPAPNKYLPIKLSYAAGQGGIFDIHPVNAMHPYRDNDNVIGAYWIITASGFNGLTKFTYKFSNDATITDNTWMSGRITESDDAWTLQPRVLTGTDFQFSGSDVPTMSGQFTCGLGGTTVPNPALGYVTIFESITSGDWTTFASPYYTTWKKTKGTVIENPATTLPSTNSKVIINPGHIVTMSASVGNLTVGSLEIKAGGVLDMGTTTSTQTIDFGSLVNVGGTGTLRISSSGATAQFPKGDFGNFLGASGGTVEYYGTGTQDFTIPYYSQTGTTSTLPNYNNLIITPNGRTITLPNIAQLTVYGDLSMGSSGIAQTYDAANNNITVNGNLLINGTVSFNEQNDQARLITVKGNTTIASGSKLMVINGGANNPATNTNFFAFEGNVTNNGILDLYIDATHYADAQFNGTADAVIDGTTGTQTDFNRLILNKGAKATTLEVTNSKFTLNASSSGANKALTLNTGTFKLNAPATITLNSGANNGYDFTIPSTAQLWLTNSSIAKIDATGTNAGIVLGGKLKVDGSAQLQMATSNVNNYIEYAPTGTPEIEIGGSATVNIGSQLRRSPDTDNGSLIYTQSGTSTVTVGSAGVPNNNVWIQKLGASNRGVFEIMSGGQFNFTGGTLTISNSSASPLPDVLIETTNGTVSKDALLKIGNTGNSSGFSISLKSALPLGSLEVISNNTANIKVLPVTLLGNATIDNNAKLLMNDLDLTVGGNMTATGTYTHGTNNTTFNGSSAQSISGTNLDFNTFTIDKTGEAVLGSNITSVNTLVLNQGVLNDNNYTLTLLGNATNNGAEHKSPGTTGRIIFGGTAKQTIDGTGGSWGSVDLNNSNNISMISNQQINNTISFNSGCLDISGNQLTLGNLFNVSKTPSATSMIRSNGLSSDQGIKLLAATGSFNYILPIGVASRYTPVTLSGNCSTAGSINCKPVNSIHYATTIGVNKTIDYYWAITTSGFAGTVTHSYDYSACTMYGVESQYVTARFYSGAWQTATGTVNTSNHTFKFNNTTNLDGEYTVGETDKFVLVADDFYSVQDGDWNDINTWDQKALPKRTSNVHVRHNVGITYDQRQCINLDLQSAGVLTVNNPTWGHSFAKVTGAGKMVLAKVNFPSGDFSSFVSSGGGTLEYTNGSYAVQNPNNSFNNVIFNSNGTLTMPDYSYTIYGNFEIKNGTTVTASSENVYIRSKGDYTNNGIYAGNASTFSFEGSTDQTISGTGANNFNNILINKSSGSLLTNSDITINGTATFTKGIVQMGTGNKTILTTSGTWTGASVNSFVAGQVQKVNNGTAFTFPVGKGYLYRPVTASGYSGTFTVEYFNNTYNENNVTDNVPPIHISPFEYWDIERSGTENCNLTFSWNYDQMPASDLTKLRMAYYDNGDNKWHIYPQASITLSPTATIASGTLTLTNPAPFGKIALATVEPPHLHCPATTVNYSASTAPATGITYDWSLSANIADLSLSADQRTATLNFQGNLESDAELHLVVKKDGNIISQKVFWLTTFPQNINPLWPNAFCSGSSLTLNAPQDINGNDFSNYEWKKDGTLLPGTTKQITITSTTTGTYQLKVYKTVSGIDGGCWSNPYSKIINIMSVTPGGVYRQANK